MTSGGLQSPPSAFYCSGRMLCSDVCLLSFRQSLGPVLEEKQPTSITDKYKRASTASQTLPSPPPPPPPLPQPLPLSPHVLYHHHLKSLHQHSHIHRHLHLRLHQLLQPPPLFSTATKGQPTHCSIKPLMIPPALNRPCGLGVMRLPREQGTRGLLPRFLRPSRTCD